MKYFSFLKENMFFVISFFFLIALNLIGCFLESKHFFKVLFPFFVPLFSIYLIKFKYCNSLFISFLMFSFLGDLSLVLHFFEGKATSLLYLLSYFCLILLVLPEVQFIKIQNLVKTYLFLVLAIAIYFIYALYLKLLGFINDDVTLLLVTLKIIGLVFLSFIALSLYFKEDSMKNVMFLIAVICIDFSAFLNFVNLYYLFNWSFVALEGIFYVLSIYFLFRYVIYDRIFASYKFNKNYKSNKVII